MNRVLDMPWEHTNEQGTRHAMGDTLMNRVLDMMNRVLDMPWETH